VQVIDYHKDYVLFVRYSSDGSMFAAACHDGTISLWETKNYTNIGTFKGHSGAVFCCFFSADDETLVSCSGDMSLRLWDVKTQKCVGTCKGHKEPVRFCSYAENGRYLLSASYDSDVKLWDTTDLDPGELVEYACIATATGHKGRVRSCSFSDDCKTAASCGDDKTVRLYDVPSMKETAVLRAHTEQVFCVSFAPDNETMATGGYDDTLRLWNYKTRQNTHTWNTAAHVFACDFGPRGFLSSCGDDMIISLYHVASKKIIASLVGHTSSTFSCDFHPTATVVISGSHDKTIRVWDQAEAMKEHGNSDMKISSMMANNATESQPPSKSPSRAERDEAMLNRKVSSPSRSPTRSVAGDTDAIAMFRAMEKKDANQLARPELKRFLESQEWASGLMSSPTSPLI